jgi:hypothetical protein
VTDYSPAFYDPMSTDRITAAVCQELERQRLIPLDPEITRFEGSGLYAIYYNGETIDLYVPLVGYKIPVYVGQAASHNSATGASAARPSPLWSRLRDHRMSIEGSALPVKEFGVRLLCLPDVHANLGENGLRVIYQPVWNGVLNGFGGKEQGPTTRQSARSKWDTVHPGRKRTFGADRHVKDELEVQTGEHIEEQLGAYDSVPWH